MDAMILPMAPKNCLKRTYSNTGLDTLTPGNVEASTHLGTQIVSTSVSSMQQPCLPDQDKAPITAIRSTTASSSPIAAAKITSPPMTITSSSTNPTKKRTKMTESEMEAKRAEKEAKDQEKAKQKAQKDEYKIRKEEEKAKKDEERRVKDAEKEKKRQEREEHTRLKEAEKKKKEEEKEKKHKSQLRLNDFFAPPSLTNDGLISLLPRGTPSPVNSRRSSIVSLSGADSPSKERSASATPSKPKPSDYARLFPPFFLQSYTTLAPLNHFERDEGGLQYTEKTIDERLSDLSPAYDQNTLNFHEMLQLSPYKRRKLDGPRPSIKKIVERMNGSSQNPIDLTDSQTSKVSQQPLEVLKTIPTKFLKFIEDVRPPYVGTYTGVQDSTTARRMCRKPFTRGLPTTDYDYDSEAEWEEPGEGEDLDSEGEEENESEDGDDMDGFLDDDDVADTSKALQKRRLVTGNLEPITTGLCWEDDNNYQAQRDLAQYQLEVILDNPSVSINPYSTVYWQSAPSTNLPTSSSRTAQSVMEPPRIPLTTMNHANLPILNPTSSLDGLKPPPNAQIIHSARLSKAPKRMVAPEVLEDFKRAVDGSDLTKAGLIEILKKQFPKQSKDAIKDTLGIVAERVGSKEKDKRWIVKGSSSNPV
ncbi:MAG: hypothetical protein Q9209_005711 [Squamulea sp. 1 TL-2023]